MLAYRQIISYQKMNILINKINTTRNLLVIITLIIINIILKQDGLQFVLASFNHSNKLTIRMPDIRPDHAEQYLCIAHRVPSDTRGHYIVGFKPQSNSSRVHHMLMYGCEEPGIYQRDSPNFVWDCSEMQQDDSNNGQMITYERGPVCNSNKKYKIMYGWAMDAPALKLPNGVGFKIGGHDSFVNFVVLQVHFGSIRAFKKLPSLTDNSGLILDLKRNDNNSGITKQAGVLVLISVGQVLQGKSKHEIWCDIDQDIDIHPFKYRVHTHKLGTRVMGAKLATNRNTIDYSNSILINDNPVEEENKIIGEGDPQKPQMFYSVKEKDLVISKGDTIYARCEFNNNGTSVVKIGSTGNDEMCNFYIMYWTNSRKLLSKDTCMSVNPRSMYNQIW